MSEQNRHWHNLLALSAPAFATDGEPPYGFVTRTLARLRAESREREVVERIGMRALFGSLVMLAATVAFTVVLDLNSPADTEPGVRNIVQVDNVQLS